MASIPYQNLNAYSMQQIQQSLNQYNQGQARGRSMPVGFGTDSYDTDRAARAPFKSGSGYGMQDEYRYMQSQGFTGAGNAPQAAAPAAPAPPPTAAPPQQTPTNVYQPQIDAANAQAARFATMMVQMQQSYQQQAAAQAAQQQRYINDLRVQQDTRMNQLATEQKAAAEKLETGQRTYQQNQSRAGQVGALQIGGATETPRTGGTQGFKRRKLQINPATADALEGILGGTAAATKTNVLNV